MIVLVTTLAATLFAASLFTDAIGAGPSASAEAAGQAGLSCTAVDGDTLRCGTERVRLLGIDAPETGGCPPGRRCAPGNGQASGALLTDLVRGREVTLTRVGQDRYGRTLALAAVGGDDLSCAMLTQGRAIYRADWDNEGRLRRICASAR